MTRKRYTEEQIIAVLKDAQAGIGIPELCRKYFLGVGAINGGRSVRAARES